MALVRDRALLLRRYPFSESSLVVRVLSRRHGRVHLLARGTMRPRSRYFALLDHFDTLELEWSESPRRELGELRAGEIAVRRRALSRSLDAYRAGLAMLELAELGSQQGQADAGCFDLLEQSLERLTDPAADTQRALVVFELGFLQNHGLAPALERCASCGREAPATAAAGNAALPRAAFSAGAGGRLCFACAAAARAAGRRVGTLPVDVLALASELLALPADAPPAPRGCEKIQETASQMPSGPTPGGVGAESGKDSRSPSDELVRERDRLTRTRDFVERFLDYHLETRPRSHRAFLSAHNRNAPSETIPSDATE